MSLNNTRSAYDQFPEREWERLESGVQARLEFLITNHALRRYLPAASRDVTVLDAGGGPGRYTVGLATQGFTVTLLDLSPKLLEIALIKIAELPTSSRRSVEAVVEGSVTDLTQFPDSAFDVVLCLGGPLSHLVTHEERTQAISELVRVAKTNSIVCVSVLNRIGAYRSAVQWIDWFDGVFPEVVQAGNSVIGPGRAPAHFFDVDELSRDLTSSGLVVVATYGCQGIGAHLDEGNLNMIMADEARWPMWKQVLLDTADDPGVVGISSHILMIARKL